MYDLLNFLVIKSFAERSAQITNVIINKKIKQILRCLILKAFPLFTPNNNYRTDTQAESAIVNRQQIVASFRRLKQMDFLEITEKRFSRKFLGRDLSEIIIIMAIMCYTLGLSYYTILKFNSFNAYAWDLGIFNQSLWTTLHTDKFLFSTVELFINPSGVFFGTHFSPILFLVLPIYSLYPSPETLLIFQSFILALGAIPLYFFTRDTLNKRTLAVSFSIAYLFYPALHGVNSFDFHVQAFLPVLFFCLMYFLSKEKWPQYFLFLFLALSVAENVPLTIMFIGLYCLWLYRKETLDSIRRAKITDKKVLIPFLTILIALLWRFFATWVQNTYFPFDPEFLQIFKAVDNWSVLGVQGDPLNIPLQILLNPYNMLHAISHDLYLKLLYLFLLFAPLLFLSLENNLMAVTLVWFVPSLLSNYQPYYLIGTHFPAYVIPFIFMAAVGAVKKRVKRYFFSTLASYARNLVLLGIIFMLIASPLSPILSNSNAAISFSNYSQRYTEHERLLHEIVAMIPRDASILTQNNIFPHFSSRTNAYVYPISLHLERTESELVDKYINDTIEKSEYVLVDLKTDNEASTAIIGKLKYLDYVTYATADGIYLFRKNCIGDHFFDVP